MKKPDVHQRSKAGATPRCVAARPNKPVLLYDGECRFCIFWAQRWYHASGGTIEIVALQDAQVALRFPELRRESLEAELHFVDTDGTVSVGAEAAFRGLAQNARRRFWLRWYLRWPFFARTAEACYRLVANNRRFFSVMTRWFFVGKPV